LDRREAVHVARADLRGQAVNQAAHVGVRGADPGDAAGLKLRLRERLDLAGDEHDLLDAEARVDRLQALVEELRQVRGVARRLRRADPQVRAFLIHPAQDQVEPAHALRALHELRTQLFRELTDHRLQVLEAADRLREGTRGERRLLRDQRRDRLEGMAHRLVEAQRHLGTEAADHRRARHGGELPDPLDAELAQRRQRVRLEAQRRHRQRRHGLNGAADRDDASAPVPGDSPGSTGRVGDRRPGVEALAR
jgi:hypothetical protein